MLTDTNLRSEVNALWDKLWSGGLSNPLDAIEQISFLLFMKRIDETEQQRERQARLRGVPYQTVFLDENGAPDLSLRWSQWTRMTGDQALAYVKSAVFPFIKRMGGAGSSFALQMANAEFKINKPSLLLEACRLIDKMNISQQNQDVQGDLYEYLLEKLNTAGRNGQFRTPRHIIRMMVKMRGPKPGEKICDPAGGTGGFLVNAYQHVLETHTSADVLTYDAEGVAHNLYGDLLTDGQRAFLQTQALTGFDSDSGMTMLRIGSMNLMLHGIASPNFRYMDTLSKAFTQTRAYDVILANPPFKGAIDASDVNPDLPSGVKKTELLFLHLFLRLLDMGGRCAAIVPDGVLFGSSNAHVAIRKKLIEENQLEGIVSMPSGVFKPYAGVSTAVMLFTRGGTTKDIWFYDMEHDGFSLDDKRTPTPYENDIPDLLTCWSNRHSPEFAAARAERLSCLQSEIKPLKAERLKMHAEINRLTFERAIASEAAGAAAQTVLDTDQQRLATLNEQIHPLQQEINQLTRQFWVPKTQVAANKYDLSASRYRQIEQDEVYYDASQTTLERLLKLEQVMAEEVRDLVGLLK